VFKGIVTAAEIEPVPLLQLPVFEFAPNTYRFRVRNGFHRFYASIVAGFECLPAVIVYPIAFTDHGLLGRQRRFFWGPPLHLRAGFWN
jgi:hypothetical protein